jgi:hypothetical protein
LGDFLATFLFFKFEVGPGLGVEAGGRFGWFGGLVVWRFGWVGFGGDFWNGFGRYGDCVWDGIGLVESFELCSLDGMSYGIYWGPA